MGFPKVHVFEVRIGTGHILPCRGGTGMCPEKRGDRVYCKAYPAPTKDRRWSMRHINHLRCGVQVWLESCRPSLQVLSSPTTRRASRSPAFLSLTSLTTISLFPITSLYFPFWVDGNVRCSNFQIAVSELLMRKPLTWGSAKFLPWSRVRHTSLLA
jgi:hypothetical protein